MAKQSYLFYFVDGSTRTYYQLREGYLFDSLLECEWIEADGDLIRTNSIIRVETRHEE